MKRIRPFDQVRHRAADDRAAACAGATKRGLPAQRNDGLQFARGLACLGVFLGHAGYYSGVLSQHEAPDWLMGQLPTFGVLLFFVLSGFLMGRIAVAGRTTAGQFAWHRFARIYPSYWIAVLLNVLVLLALNQPVAAPDPTYLLLLPLNFGGTPYEIPAWTLIYESMFYMLVCALIALRAGKRTLLTFCLVWATAIIALDYAELVYFHHVAPGRFIFVSRMNLLFIAGMLLALIGTRWFARVPFAVLLVAAVGLWWVGLKLSPMLVVPHLAFVTSSALTLIAFSQVTWKSRVLVSLGDASYGIYLVHYFVLTALFRLAARAGLVASLPVAFAGFVVLGLAISWAYGALEFSLYRKVTAKT